MKQTLGSMSDSDQKGEVRHVNIYRCKPQADNPNWSLFDKIPAEDLDDYEHTKDIVRGFLGRLEKKQYRNPSRKNARAHDFNAQDTQETLNRLSRFSLEDEESEEEESTRPDGGAAAEVEEEEESKDDSEEFHDIAKAIIQKYNDAANSVNCFLLIIEYEWESDRFGSDNRLMVVQLPFKEDMFIPEDGETSELFSELQEAFENRLKKSVLYPYQEVPESTESDEESEAEKEDETEAEAESDTDEGVSGHEENLGNAFLYQRNGQADYWHEFLELYGENHKDEILADQRIRMVKQFHDEDEDNPDDPFAKVESLEDLDKDDLPDEVEEYRESGVVVEVGNIKIQGLTVGEILEQDLIGFYEDDTGEIYTVIQGDEPSISPVGRGTIKLPEEENDDDDDGDDQSDGEESVDIPVFPRLSEYPDVSDFLND